MELPNSAEMAASPREELELEGALRRSVPHLETQADDEDEEELEDEDEDDDELEDEDEEAEDNEEDDADDAGDEDDDAGDEDDEDDEDFDDEDAEDLEDDEDDEDDADNALMRAGATSYRSGPSKGNPLSRHVCGAREARGWQSRTGRLILSAALLGIVGCGGLGSRPPNENAALDNGVSPDVSLEGCVITSRDGGYRLRSMPKDESAGLVREGASTSVNGNWLGSRDYEVTGVPPGQDLAALAGQRVAVSGTVRIPAGIETAGTDQMQARQGARFPQLELASLTPLAEPCVDAAAADRAREPSQPTPHAAGGGEGAEETRPAGRSPNQPVH